jgi:beta-phosphoglucomutase
MLEAVIFDFDRVIAETERLHHRAMARVMRPEGIRVDWAEFRDFYRGLGDAPAIRRALEIHDRAVDEALVQRLASEKDREYQRLIATKARPVRGALEFVRRVARSWPVAICSGAHRRDIDVLLKRFGIDGLFQVIVSADDVAESKPHPAGYELTVQRLRSKHAKLTNLTADQCVAIEDSAPGVRAARAAGMRVIRLVEFRDIGHVSNDQDPPDGVVSRLAWISNDVLAAHGSQLHDDIAVEVTQTPRALFRRIAGPEFNMLFFFILMPVYCLLIFFCIEFVLDRGGPANSGTLGGAMGAGLLWWVIRIHTRERQKPFNTQRKQATGRITCTGFASEVTPLLGAVDVAFEPRVYRGGEAGWGSRGDWRKLPVSIILFLMLFFGFQIAMSRGARWLGFSLNPAYMGGLIMAVAAATSAIQAFVFPMQYRVSPGRLDLMRFGWFGLGRPSIDRFDLRSCRIDIDYGLNSIAIEDARGGKRFLSMQFTEDRAEFGLYLVQAAISTAKPKSLPNDALLE